MTVATLLLLAAYFSLWPVPIEPVAWHAPTALGYTGAHAANTRLVGLRSVALDGDVGPEHVVPGPRGGMYTGVANGRILRMQLDGSGRQISTSWSSPPPAACSNTT